MAEFGHEDHSLCLLLQELTNKGNRSESDSNSMRQLYRAGDRGLRETLAIFCRSESAILHTDQKQDRGGRFRERLRNSPPRRPRLAGVSSWADRPRNPAWRQPERLGVLRLQTVPE